MTHNFLRDKDYLAVLPRLADAPYIAMLGPAARTQRILMDLAEEGVDDQRGPPRADPRSRRPRPGRARVPRRSPQAILAEIVAVDAAATADS